MVAGLSTAVIVALICVALGEQGTAVYAPRVITTFFIGAIIVNSLLAAHPEFMHSDDSRLVLAVVFAVVLAAGAFQVLFGLTRVGSLLKHTPHPVMAGFQNAAALLLALVQTATILGFERHVPFTKVFGHVDEFRWLSVFVALSAGLGMWHAKRIAPKVPALIVGLAIGSLVYLALYLLGFSRSWGRRWVPRRPSSRSRRRHRGALADLALHPQFAELTPAILTSALSLALVASIDALLCSRLLGAPPAIARSCAWGSATWPPPAWAASPAASTSAPASRTAPSAGGLACRCW
jgi:MFS superfamily sulfate permease-like transporter